MLEVSHMATRGGNSLLEVRSVVMSVVTVN